MRIGARDRDGQPTPPSRIFPSFLHLDHNNYGSSYGCTTGVHAALFCTPEGCQGSIRRHTFVAGRRDCSQSATKAQRAHTSHSLGRSSGLAHECSTHTKGALNTSLSPQDQLVANPTLALHVPRAGRQVGHIISGTHSDGIAPHHASQPPHKQ